MPKVNSEKFQGLEEIEIIAKSVMWVRDQINRPSLDKSPAQFVESVDKFISGLEISIHDKTWLEKNNFGVCGFSNAFYSGVRCCHIGV